MSDLSTIPLQDGFETQLSQEWNGATGTVYVLSTPSYTPTTTDTYVVVSPGKTNMQIARVTNYDSTAKTLTIDSISFEKALGVSSTAQTHPTGSKVIISDNYQFWADIQTAINSKLDKNGGNVQTYATTADRDTALGGDGVATLPYSDIYVTATGLFYNYNLNLGQWQVVSTGTAPANATTSTAGVMKTDVAPVGIPVAFTTDNTRYLATAGAGGTPSASNLFETQFDTSNAATYTASTISFNSGTKTISDSANGFVTAGFKQGTELNISGSSDNDGTVTIISVTAGAIVVAESLVTESAGASIELWTPKADKLLRLDQSGNISSVFLAGVMTKQYTISGGVIAGDVVYPSSADTVKKIGPSAMSTGTAVSTSPDHLNATRSMPLSTNGLYLHVSGGSQQSAFLYAQVRTINALETNFTNGTEQTVYGTGNGVRWYDICNIGGDKFLLVFQADTGGTEAGIKAVVISISGTNITVGLVQTIESTGGLGRAPSCAKLGTDRAIIFYQKDADSDIYGQVLTVATTTISTNTPVSVRVTGNTCQTYAVSLGTDIGMIIYADNSRYLFGRTFTVSGTVPTFNTEQQVYDNVSVISSTNHVGLGFISSTKVLFLFGENGIPVNDFCSILTISGASISKGADLALSATQVTDYFGISVIGSTYALVADFASNTQMVLRLLDISGATPVQLAFQNLGLSTTSNNYEGISVVKVLPWTYMISGPITDGDYIVKLTPVSSARVGMAESTIADGATGAIAKRFNSATLSALTVGSKYYLDDNGNITLSSSLTAPEVGYADSTTNLILI